jgi:hypothetical protein
LYAESTVLQSTSSQTLPRGDLTIRWFLLDPEPREEIPRVFVLAVTRPGPSRRGLGPIR